MKLRYGTADINVRKRSIRDVILHESRDDENRIRTKDAPAYFSREGELAVANAVNRLAEDGIRASVFSPVILLPPETEEEVLRVLMRQICRAAFPQRIRIGEVHAEVTDAVTRPVVLGTAAGEQFGAAEDGSSAETEDCPPTEKEPSAETEDGPLPEKDSSADTLSSAEYRDGPEREDPDIVIAGPVGLEGTFHLVTTYSRELAERFPATILNRMSALGRELSILPAAEAAAGACAGKRPHLPAMVSLGDGGLFTGLWRLSEKTGCGLEVDLQAVPILQETIEITNHLGINPYAMRSAGSILIAAPDGKHLVRHLQEAGFDAARIGKVIPGKNKIIRNGDETRHLDRPQTDTLAAWERRQRH